MAKLNSFNAILICVWIAFAAYDQAAWIVTDGRPLIFGAPTWLVWVWAAGFTWLVCSFVWRGRRG